MALSDAEVAAALDSADENAPKPLALAGTGGTQVHVPPAEARKRREVVSQLLAGGSDAAMIAEATAKTFGMTEPQTNRLIEEVRATWLEEDATNAQYAKSAAIRRHKGHVRKAVSKGAWPAVSMLEKNLMQLEGTATPTEVRLTGDVRVSHALMETLGEMDPAEVRRLIEEERQREVLLTDGSLVEEDADLVIDVQPERND